MKLDLAGENGDITVMAHDPAADGTLILAGCANGCSPQTAKLHGTGVHMQSKTGGPTYKFEKVNVLLWLLAGLT